ncbi:MAG TPA: hypothetical protein PLP19_04170 [bacterium]|nr:hypothetical protein [bacterium]HPN42665.1 hypothetical protein [bacterium]
MFSFRYDISNENIERIFSRIDQKVSEKKIKCKIDEASKENIIKEFNQICEKNKNRPILKRFKDFLISFVTDWPGSSGSTEDEIRSVLEKVLRATGNTNYTDEVIQQYVNEITYYYPQNEIDSTDELWHVPVFLIFILFLFFVFSFTGYSQKFVDVLKISNDLADFETPSRFKMAIGLVFFWVGSIAFLFAVLVPFISAFQFTKNKVAQKSVEFRRGFFSIIPTKIMNLGIIPMIFAIIGIIFFKENQLLDFKYYWDTWYLMIGIMPDYKTISQIAAFKWGFSQLHFIMVLGGLAEVGAFYLGYKFPKQYRPKETVGRKEIQSVKGGVREAAVVDVQKVQINPEEIAEGIKIALNNAKINIK